MTPMYRATLPHVQSIIAQYTKLDAKCDYLSVDVESTWPRPPSSPGVLNTQTDNCRLFMYTCTVSVTVVDRRRCSQQSSTVDGFVGWSFCHGEIFLSPQLHMQMGHVNRTMPLCR